MRLKLVDVTLPQLTTAQNDICNDMLVADLRDMRNQKIINAFKEAFKESGDPMKELYNRYDRSMIGKGRVKGRAEGHAEGRGEMASRTIASGKLTLSDVSALTGQSEESLQSAIDAWNKRRIHS